MCKEVALEGIACEGVMQFTLFIWDNYIGKVCRENMSDINLQSGSEVGKK